MSNLQFEDCVPFGAKEIPCHRCPYGIFGYRPYDIADILGSNLRVFLDSKEQISEYGGKNECHYIANPLNKPFNPLKHLILHFFRRSKDHACSHGHENKYNMHTQTERQQNQDLTYNTNIIFLHSSLLWIVWRVGTCVGNRISLCYINL